MRNEFISIMTERIVRDFDPLEIIIFGSQARGDTNQNYVLPNPIGAVSQPHRIFIRNSLGYRLSVKLSVRILGSRESEYLV